MSNQNKRDGKQQSGLYEAGERYALCPSCGQHSRFHYAGTQTWPARVALKRGIPQTVDLWTCDHCGTSLTAQTLDEHNESSSSA